MSLDFPTRSAAFADDHGISQSPCYVFPYMPGVSDLAGPYSSSPFRWSSCCLPCMSTSSAPWSHEISRLNTLPVRTSINVPPPPLRTAAYDLRPAWLAMPSL